MSQFRRPTRTTSRSDQAKRLARPSTDGRATSRRPQVGSLFFAHTVDPARAVEVTRDRDRMTSDMTVGGYARERDSREDACDAPARPRCLSSHSLLRGVGRVGGDRPSDGGDRRLSCGCDRAGRIRGGLDYRWAGIRGTGPAVRRRASSAGEHRADRAAGHHCSGRDPDRNRHIRKRQRSRRARESLHAWRHDLRDRADCGVDRGPSGACPRQAPPRRRAGEFRIARRRHPERRWRPTGRGRTTDAKPPPLSTRR
jgi:hypothetical protein